MARTAQGNQPRSESPERLSRLLEMAMGEGPEAEQARTKLKLLRETGAAAVQELFSFFGNDDVLEDEDVVYVDADDVDLDADLEMSLAETSDELAEAGLGQGPVTIRPLLGYNDEMLFVIRVDGEHGKLSRGDIGTIAAVILRVQDEI